MTTDTRPATGRTVLTALAALVERYPDLDCAEDAVTDLLDEVGTIVRKAREAVRRARPPAEKPEPQREEPKVQEKHEPAEGQARTPEVAPPTPEQPVTTAPGPGVRLTWPAYSPDPARVAEIRVSDTPDGPARRFVPAPEPAPAPAGRWGRVRAWVDRNPVALFLTLATLTVVAATLLAVLLGPSAGACAAMALATPRYGGRRDRTLTRDETRRVARELRDHAQALRQQLLARGGQAAREMTVDFKRGVEHAATLLEHRATDVERRGLAAS